MATKDSGKRQERTKSVLLPGDLGDKHTFDFYASLPEFVLKPEPDGVGTWNKKRTSETEQNWTPCVSFAAVVVFLLLTVS